jgi:Protein of unknown function (DUF1656).
MSWLDQLRTPEIRIGEFLIPWGMMVSTLGFLAAWFLVSLAERLCWTRHVWQLPAFFIALAVFLGCLFGLVLAP